MEQDRDCVDGYAFGDRGDMEKAKKEKQTIDKLKQTISAEDVESMRRVYDKLITKGYFSTPVGLGFLHDMRSYLAEAYGEDELLPVPVPGKRKEPKQSVSAGTDARLSRLEEENVRLNSLKQRLVIAVFALCAVVVGMILIVINNENLGYFNAEEKVLDKYSAWQERLTDWEEELNIRESLIREQEKSQNP